MGRVFEYTDLKNIKPIRDIVYEQLRKAILEGTIKPGERIVENEYADMLNISRTPVREALRKLEIEGFVEYIPRKGVIVKGFSLKDIIEIFEIRKALECLAVKHVVENISDEEIEALKEIIKKMEEAGKEDNYERIVDICQHFHQSILDASSMPRLQSMISTLQEYLERFKRVTLAKDTRRTSAIKEHKEIMQAIIEKDVSKAEELTIKHIDASRKAFLNGYQVNLE